MAVIVGRLDGMDDNTRLIRWLEGTKKHTEEPKRVYGEADDDDFEELERHMLNQVVGRTTCHLFCFQRLYNRTILSNQ